jgi:pimeloyl-ACP methyl ester carboxylesterase
MSSPLARTTITLDGHKIYSQEITAAAGKPTFVFVHGIGMSGSYFQPVAQYLPPDYGRLIVDLPGFGRSSKPVKTLNLADQARLVHRMVLDKRIDKPIYVGHSMGCQIVVELLHRYRGPGVAAILIAPTVYDRERTTPAQVMHLLTDSAREPFALNLLLAYSYMQTGLRRYMTTLDYMLSDEIERKIPNVAAPLLIIRGERDPFVPRAWVDKLASGSSNAAVVEVANAPHAVHFASPKQVAEICIEWVITL